MTGNLNSVSILLLITCVFVRFSVSEERNLAGNRLARDRQLLRNLGGRNLGERVMEDRNRDRALVRLTM